MCFCLRMEPGCSFTVCFIVCESHGVKAMAAVLVMGFSTVGALAVCSTHRGAA